ncbi:DNA alkylation repair protein [Barrientosiimonas endolithica]|uniref:DNA alkylation repair protein n=1 Tax=Barrientosiimonas endolithica TaxID=1535208 RepID=A0ABN6YU33_9MICO|nr:DNA alkylation repair protein [Barrientosiimonas endolithica]BDZ59390.1 DNA alkylation repair protein [Barrientosiimonas endolithica]
MLREVARTYRGVVGDPQVVAQVRGLVRAAGDAERAAAQQAYMRSSMPFRGITSPQLRTLLRPALAVPVGDRAEWERAVRLLYDGARFREERYAALGLLRHRAYRAWRDPGVMPLVRHLVVTGAWWDLVDDAAHVVAEVRLRDPVGEAARLREWARDPDRWLRRAAIIGQLRAKDRTDADLLRDVVDANLGDPDFFVRKAIGWALRDLSTTAPDWVRAFVAEREGRLSPLSRREALKRIGPSAAAPPPAAAGSSPRRR